ncbi:MAG TPA: flavin reductase family protein [Acidimicrobiia bacterium]|nr:flavin reductase family protein [Acidimicrobiia bacterium]
MDAFEEIVSTFDPPMFVVTARAGDEQDGCLVGFTTQCSIDPHRFVVCLSEKNRTTRLAQQCEILVVHSLRAEQYAIAEHFGTETGDDVDKFATVAWHEGPNGTPVLTGCDWFAGRVLAQLDDWGDHLGFVLEVIDAEIVSGGERLGLQSVIDLDPGHAP